jgi:hypothetical protein
MMTLAIFLTMKRGVMGCFCAGMLAAVSCADGRVPTRPSASAAVSDAAETAPGDGETVRQVVTPSVTESSPRSGDLHVTKECSEYMGAAGSFCTITSSNLKQIEVGTKVIYASAPGATSLDSDVVLDPPGPGNNTAFGHCHLDFATGLGLCTFSGGTGKFTRFEASADVSSAGAPNWVWEGTYSFSPRD